MVSERKEPTFSSADLGDENSKPPLKDRGMEKSAGDRSKARPQPKAPVQRTPPTVSGLRSSPLLPIALILALTGLGLAGFVYWQLLQVQLVLVSSEQRIVELEERLNLSSDESSESLTVLQANLKEANHEIAKLWDTRNVNRSGIAENKQSVTALESSLKKLTATVDGAKKSLAAQDSSLKAVAAKVEQALAVKADVAAQAKMLKSLSQQLEQASAGIRQLGDYGVRIKTNEEAIEAIDAYRYQINRQILDLQKRLGTSQAG